MLTYLRFFSFAIIGVFLVACNKDKIAFQDEELEVITPHYELLSFHYFLEGDDGVDTTTIKLPGAELTNPGSSLSQQDVKVNYDELVKKSNFLLDSITPLPAGLMLDTFRVKVPSIWYADNRYSFYANSFRLTADQEEPYKQSIEDVLHLRIPPRSRLVVSAEIDAYNLTCSFRAVFRDRNSGIQDTVNGKWKGTLRYDNSSIKLKEYPLAEKDT
ncbi:hypothetical protein RYH73_00965 [Olivibacter sp. CPCC 100613]|uniref:hypothetical protein n=1 Tax=Olivibacter sp. CPCC 100613 TaxID=3079931 RepID=UPI002FF89B4B